MTDVYSQPAAAIDRDRAALEQAEMAAYEKGRMQGEMEAIRRVEAENAKQMIPAEQNTLLQRPDVVEIHRLTWPQRVSFALGELSFIATLVLTIVWAKHFDVGYGWTNSTNGNGDISQWNTGLLTGVLGLICLGQAITNYRFMPLNLNANLNRAWYIIMQACAIVCFSLTMAAQVMTQPEATFWSVDQWCFAFGFALAMSHSLYSIFHVVLERPVDHQQWAEHGNQFESPEQARDKSAFNQYGRAVYTPAPTRLTGATHLPANANVGAQVPVAPGNAPRWAENPNTHAEDYFLVPRAKWATIGFFTIGASILMMIAGLEQVRATGGASHWSQVNDAGDYQLNEVGQEAQVIGASGLLLLLALGFMSYVAMPPRTTLVKNGILTEPGVARRTSVSTTHVDQAGQHNIV